MWCCPNCTRVGNTGNASILQIDMILNCIAAGRQNIERSFNPPTTPLTTVGARIPNIGIPNILKITFPMVQKQDGHYFVWFFIGLPLENQNFGFDSLIYKIILLFMKYSNIQPSEVDYIKKKSNNNIVIGCFCYPFPLPLVIYKLWKQPSFQIPVKFSFLWCIGKLIYLPSSNLYGLAPDFFKC